MKKVIFLITMLLFMFVSSCTLSGKNQGNNNQNDIYYKISFDSNFGSFVDSQEIKEGECAVKPTDPTKEKFKFLYWTLNNIEYDFNTPVTSNITLVALWQQVGYHVHDYVGTKVEPTCLEKGYTVYLCNCGDTFKDNYIDESDHDEEKHPAKSPTTTEIGWDEYVTCSICGYTTYKEVSKVTAAQLEIYEENGRKYVDFGSYPQTHVANQDLINELNKLNETNERGYYEYNKNEYAKVKADPYSTNYTDQYGQTHNFKYSSGADIKNNTYEWFKVEPIKWRILSNNSDTYYVLSEYILTTQLYHKDAYYRLIDGVDVPANDYKYSDIREFLTNTFLNSAFTLKQQDSLVITGLDNSAIPTASSSNTYVWENTFDKIYLLSFQDMYNINYGFHSNAGEYDEARKAALTDYAKATGCWRLIDNDNLDMGFWWLRSPDSVDPRFAGSVNYNGVVSMHTIFVSYVGVRPATAIAIQ